jgi:hypothetical protein
LRQQQQNDYRKLKKVWTMLQSAKSELADLQVTMLKTFFSSSLNVEQIEEGVFAAGQLFFTLL